MERAALALALILVLGLPASLAGNPGGGDSLVVIGMHNQVKKKAWRDQRLGMGIRGRLTQMYADSGAFALLEDRHLAPSVQEAVNGYWLSEGQGQSGDLAALLEETGADWVAYGDLTYLGMARSRVTGVISGRSWTYRAQVNLCIRGSVGAALCRTGEAKSTTRVVGAVIEYRGNDNVAFDQAGPAEAIDQALAEAFNTLMPEWERTHAS